MKPSIFDKPGGRYPWEQNVNEVSNYSLGISEQ